MMQLLTRTQLYGPEAVYMTVTPTKAERWYQDYGYLAQQLCT